MRKVLLLALLCAFPAWAATETVAIDWNEYAEEMANPQRYAISHPVAFDSATHGTWQGGYWTLSVRVPGAENLAVRLDAEGLGESRLIVGGEVLREDRLAYPSMPRDGDSYRLSLRVAEGEAPRVRIHAVLAGFRNPEAAASGPTTKSEAQACKPLNYSCERSAANDGPSRASVLVSIEGEKICSGTLLNNNASGEPRPILYTAGHCQSGSLEEGETGSGLGGKPTGEDFDEIEGASKMRIFYLYEAPCGFDYENDDRPSRFSSRYPQQFGARHLFEHQESWLVELNELPPAAANVHLAGFSAVPEQERESSTLPMYGIHHAGGTPKQFWDSKGELIRWTSGSLGDYYTIVHGRGRGLVAPGASGSALFNPDNKVTGTLSESTAARCEEFWEEFQGNPGSTYHRLDRTWDAGAQQFLDDGTGARQVAGRDDPWDRPSRDARITMFTMAPNPVRPNEPVQLEWMSEDADTCSFSVAGGGQSIADLSAEGAESFSAPVAEGVYEAQLSCTSVDGSGTKDSVTEALVVEREEAVIADFEPTLREAQREISLTYRAENVQQCELGGSWLARAAWVSEQRSSAGVIERREVPLQNIPVGSHILMLECRSGSASVSRQHEFHIANDEQPEPVAPQPEESEVPSEPGSQVSSEGGGSSGFPLTLPLLLIALFHRRRLT